MGCLFDIIKRRKEEYCEGPRFSSKVWAADTQLRVKSLVSRIPTASTLQHSAVLNFRYFLSFVRLADLTILVVSGCVCIRTGIFFDRTDVLKIGGIDGVRSDGVKL